MNNSIIAGALFDFMGWLTSRPKRIMLSSVDDASPAVDAIKDFAKMRGLSLDDAQVETWQEALAQPEQEPVAWAVQACSKMWRGEFAEIDAKAEAKRIGGTCVAYALYTSPPQREWQSLTDEDWEKVSNRKNTVLDTFEQGATWAAYKLERRNT